MATRGIIARKTSNTMFEGRYHHWDSYPEGLGETLRTLYQGHFHGDLATMLKVLIDEHPAGWSTINDRDFTLAPGFRDDPSEDNRQPECYCHGARHEPERLYTSLPNPNQTWIDYVYVIDVNALMTVYHRTPYLNRDGYTWEVVKTDMAGAAHIEIPMFAQSLMDGMPSEQVVIPMGQVIEVWESTAYVEGMEATWYVTHRYMDEDLCMAICYIVSEGTTCKGHCYVWALEDVAVQTVWPFE